MSDYIRRARVQDALAAAQFEHKGQPGAQGEPAEPRHSRRCRARVTAAESARIHQQVLLHRLRRPTRSLWLVSGRLSAFGHFQTNIKSIFY